MHFLNTDQLFDAAARLGIENTDMIMKQMTALQTQLAEKVAEKLKIVHMDSGFDVGGLESNFGPLTTGQACPETIAEYDKGSDWVLEPESIEAPVPFFVLFWKDGYPDSTAPCAFRCHAVNERSAEIVCGRENSDVRAIAAIQQTGSLQEAMSAFYEKRTPNPDAEDTSRAPVPLENESYSVPVALHDHDIERPTVYGELNVFPLGLSLRVDGHTDYASVDDAGEVVLVTHERGDLYVTVYGSVNQEEPTHRINLRDAKNDARQILRSES
jgi:hypothetical protein